MLLPLDVGDGRFRLDQLQIESVPWTLEEMPLGQDAEAYPVRNQNESEETRVKLHPVGGATGPDVLDDPEEMQPFDWSRGRLRGVDRTKVNVVDRKLVVAIDEVDEALAHAVNGRDVQLHRTCAHWNLPRAKIERAAKRVVCVADTHSERADHGPLDGLHGARNVRGLGINDEVHRALPIDFHFSRAMPADGMEAHFLEKAAQCLRARRCEFNELDAVKSDRIDGF